MGTRLKDTVCQPGNSHSIPLHMHTDCSDGPQAVQPEHREEDPGETGVSGGAGPASEGGRGEGEAEPGGEGEGGEEIAQGVQEITRI